MFLNLQLNIYLYCCQEKKEIGDSLELYDCLYLTYYLIT